MKTHIWILLSIVLLVAISCQKNKSAQEESTTMLVLPFNTDVEADKQALMNLNNEWDMNTMAGNIKKNAALYTEDAIRIDGGKIYEGREAISNLLQSYAKGTTPPSMENKTENIWISGDIATVRGATKGSFIQDESGDTLYIKGAWSSVYERQADGKWKIVFSIGTELKQ